MNTTTSISAFNELVLSYSPLVRATAHRYKGRGAEYEDLVQEGFLAVMVLIPKCDDLQWLAAFLKNRLPGYVRAAAGRMRSLCSMESRVELDIIEEITPESGSALERTQGELNDILHRSLTDDELDLTQALLEGFTQSDIAEILGISQQAVSARLRNIRVKLADVIR